MKTLTVDEILIFSNLDQNHSPDADLNPNGTCVRMKAMPQLQHTQPCNTLVLAVKYLAQVLVVTGIWWKIQIPSEKGKIIRPR